MSYENLPYTQQLSASEPSERAILYFQQLRGEIITILNAQAASGEAIRNLKTELAVYKRAYNDVEGERKRLEALKQGADKQIEDLGNQLKGHRIVCLLDGDGVIFSQELISQGRSGGHLAARKLSESILQHLSETNGTNQYQLWVYIFANKRGLQDTLGRARLHAAKNNFDDFIIGFNQAAERFMMVDVGSGKEAADAKIKALLEDEVRLPQTEKIIFGGCHDNGYVSTLRSQITAGYKTKLILLRGYTEVAAGINDLDLPSFSIPDLFMPTKLVPIGTGLSPKLSYVPFVPNNITPQDCPPIPDTAVTVNSSGPSNIQHGFEVLPFASALDTEIQVPKTPPSYSSAVRTAPQKRACTPESESGGSSTSNDGSEESLPNTRPTLTQGKSRVNRNIPLSKHKPPPCTLYYLSTCKHGVDCKYGHDYDLEAEHYTEIRVNAKKSPCPSKNKGEICVWGDDCCYGHYCPLTTKCHFRKQNRCKFVGGDMHKDPKSQSVDTA